MSSPCARRREGHSEEAAFALRCNYVAHGGKPCARQVLVGYLTSCRHLFCDEHAKEWFGSNAECHVCRDGGSLPKLIKVNFQRDEMQVRAAMLGRQPEEILAAASEAFCFWTGQKILEHDRRAADMDGQRARGAELRAAYKERASAARAAADGLKEENAVLGKCLKGALGCAERLQAEREQLRGRMAQLRQAGERRAAAGATWRPATAEDWAAAAPPRRSRGGGRGAPLLGHDFAPAGLREESRPRPRSRRRIG